MANEVDFAILVDGEGEDVGQSPTIGILGPPNAIMEDANNLKTPDRGDVDARNITNTCDDPTAIMEGIAMQVE